MLGALVCFWGYRLLRATLGMVGFTVGAFLGAAVASSVFHASPAFVLVVSVVAGILGGVLAVVLYKVGVFLLGAGGAALVAGVIIAGAGGVPRMFVLVLFGIAGGVLTLLLQRPLVSILTAFAGAWAVAAGVFQLCGWYGAGYGYHELVNLRSSVQHFGWMLALWAALGIAGAIVQLRKHRRKD